MKTKIINKKMELAVVSYDVNFRKISAVNDVMTCLLMSYLEMKFQLRNSIELYIVKRANKQSEFSITEDLMINKRTFIESFKKIGMIYNSTDEYYEASNKFRGKYYACIKNQFDPNRVEFRRNYSSLSNDFGIPPF